MHHKQKNILLILAGAGIVLVVGALIVFLEMRILQLGSEKQNLTNKLNEQQNLLSQKENSVANPETLPTGEPSTPETGSDAFGNYITAASQTFNGTSSDIYKDYTQNFVDNKIEVNWRRGAKALDKTQTLNLLQKADPALSLNDFKESCDGGAKCRIYIYELGTLSAPNKLSGKTLYLFAIPAPGMGMYYDTKLVFFEESTKQFIVLTQNEYPLYQPNKKLFSGMVMQQIDDLTTPFTLNIPGSKSTLHFDHSETNPYPPKNEILYSADANRGGIIDIENNKIIDYSRYNANNLAFTDPKYGPVYLYNRAYHIILPDGSVQIYELIPSFLKPLVPEGADKNLFSGRFETAINWTDGRTPFNEVYMIGGDIRNGGCVTGITPCTNIVNKNSWFKETNLTSVGTTPDGDLVYELKDQATNAYYKQLFDFGYAASRLYPNTDQTRQPIKPAITQDQLDAMSDAEKFKDFLLDHPLFFWKDETGNWRIYQKAKYQSMVECGKPVIYLYPTKETNVHVEVKPQGGLTKTEPVYGTHGWNVTATPSGKLTNLADQKAYPYLFWEGIGYNYAKPTQGFVLKRENVQSEMKKILGRLGLNENEQKDFLEFWAPKLETKPFVFVTFVDQKEFDTIAPLTISPKPDSVIRVFMDYTPLEKPLTVAPLTIKTPERKGFTVVEWGGALHK